MKKYIGIKFVNAEPMTAEEAEEKGYRVSGNKGDGYEVTYEDGYKSWYPRDGRYGTRHSRLYRKRYSVVD